jgi:DNA polymerase-3 subunit delta'
MTFADFVGNARIVAVLRRMLDSGRIPHALLFAGQKGIGKFTLATLLARALNCEKGMGEICGGCGNCRALSSLEDLAELQRAALAARGSANPEAVPLILRPHPSVSVLVPDGAYIRVAQMRYVIRQAYTVPAGARRNVFLIDQAERLRFDFADVLLKVLEEPPEHTTLVLVTSAPFELRPTIRSRCIPLFFAPLRQAEIEAYLKSHRPDWKKQDRALAAAASAGSLGTALSLDLERYRQVRSEALDLLRAGLGQKTDPEAFFAATAALAGKGPQASPEAENLREGFEFSLDIVYSLLRDVLYCQVGTSELGLCHPDLRSELETLARRVSRSWLEEATGRLDRIKGWQRRNVNRQLALDAWALGSPHLSEVIF